MLIAGTDGVFDRVSERFHCDLMRMAIYRTGDLSHAARESIEQLAGIVDSDHSFVCDDNLTLGIIADGNLPKFEPKFWKTPSASLSPTGA